ncbi:MAG: hypothetical protein V4671_21325 [Armatimonadota bacterium]
MQYIFLNRAPGPQWKQNEPASVTDALFHEPLDAIGVKGTPDRRLGLAFILSYFNGPLDSMEESLRRLLALSEKQDTPVLLALDGENWWGSRPDLWNWFDPSRPGYNPANRQNVEWTGWDPSDAVKIGWRNWGSQIRVLPQPNLASPRFREASRVPLARLAKIIKNWGDSLPDNRRYLYPGIKVGWEASLGINAFYYPDGNRYWEMSPTDASKDPKHGLDMKKDFAGGLTPLGYAALTSKGWKHNGPVTLADQERITADYLDFISGVCRRAGIPRTELFTHSGGQFSPWELHYSHRVAINRNAIPGWSLYGHGPEKAGDLGESLTRAKMEEWCAAEWLPHATTAAEWARAYEDVLSFRRCRFVDLYNWEGIRNKPEAIEGLRRALRPR